MKRSVPQAFNIIVLRTIIFPLPLCSFVMCLLANPQSAFRTPQLRRSRAVGLSVGTMALLLLLAACRSTPAPLPSIMPGPSAQELANMPLQFAVQLQVIELKETVPSGGGLFPAPGFELRGGVIQPTLEPGTLAGLELTPEQFDQWAQKLKEARAELYMAPSFTILPGRSAGNKDTMEVPYHANWSFRERIGVPQQGVQRPGLDLSLQPSLIEGRKEAMLKVAVSWQLARLEEFQVAAAKMAGKKQVGPALTVQLPEQRTQSLLTAMPVRNGNSVVAAHFVRQRVTPENGRVREHFFYIVTLQRVGKEPEPAPTPAALPERCALSLSWLEWVRAPEGAPAAPETLEAAVAAAQPSAHVDAWSVGLACSPEALVRCEWTESAACVTGIQADADNVRRFSMAGAACGVRGEMRLSQSELGPTAVLTAELSGPAAWRPIRKVLESLRGEGEEEYHFRAGRQFTARVEQPMAVGERWVPLAASWAPRLAGDPSEQPLADPDHFAAASLRAMPLIKDASEPAVKTAPAP